jgi:hypothetical protein
MSKACALFLCTITIFALLGCAAVASRKTTYDLTGVWFGTLRLSCAGHCLSPEISFTLFELPSGVRGFYKCLVSSNDCPDPGYGGKVTIPDPQSSPLSIRVLMNDGSGCLFQGVPQGDEITGDRFCYSSHGSISAGSWYVRRAY